MEPEEKVTKHKFFKSFVTGILIVGVFVSGVFTGTSYGMRAILQGDRSFTVSAVSDLFSQSNESSISFEQFWNVWRKVQEKYVYTPVNEVDLFYGSMVGMVNALNDPYSVFMPPAKAEEFKRDLSGEFFGIGAEIGLKNGAITVIAPLAQSPAERAGLRAGDTILLVDETEVSGKSVDEVVTLIRGEKGTSVKLTVLSEKSSTPREITIVRDVITVPTVTWSMKDADVAYLRISYFNDTTWNEFDKAVKEIKAKKPRGIVLDLRSNPGGYLDTSVKVANEWVESGPIVYEKYHDGSEDQYSATGGTPRFQGIPTVVLVDGGTASGSEIVSGALQDYGLATLVGSKTFGKGSVQDFEYFADGSALKLTIAEWFTPRKRQINKVGIEPDHVIEEMFVQKEGTEGTTSDDFIDKGLEKALELLRTP